MFDGIGVGFIGRSLCLSEELFDGIGVLSLMVEVGEMFGCAVFMLWFELEACAVGML